MEGCRFCGSKYQKERNVISNEHFFANFDDNPVTRGHMKIIPKRHVDSFFDMSDAEVMAAFGLLRECRGVLEKRFNPDAYNIGINDGNASGQTISHLHIHLIPRYKGDVPDPAGGVRNVIPGKGDYLKKGDR